MILFGCAPGSQGPCVLLLAMAKSVGEKVSTGGHHCEGRIIFTSTAHTQIKVSWHRCPHGDTGPKREAQLSSEMHLPLASCPPHLTPSLVSFVVFIFRHIPNFSANYNVANWPSGAQERLFIEHWDAAILERPGKKLGQCWAQELCPVASGRKRLQEQGAKLGLGFGEHQRLPPAASGTP